MLFGDVKQGDVCSNPLCFGKKIERTIDVTLLALEASSKKVACLSSQYNRTPQTPKDALTTAQYDRIHNGKACDDTVIGVFIDGSEEAKQIKLKVLLMIAGKVHQGGKHVMAEDVERVRAAGGTNLEIHDTVLIAAAFCMYNRYLEELATWVPEDEHIYRQMADRVVNTGYT